LFAGTVLYSHACTLQEALLSNQDAAEPDALAAYGGGSKAGGGGRGAAEQHVQSTFAHAAQYIALAYAMQPGKQVYSDSLAAVQRLLPLPHLRVGPLLAAHPDSADGPREEWVACWFGLGPDVLAAMRPPAAHAGQGGLLATPPRISCRLEDITDARLAADPSLPAGTAFWLSLHSRPR
jgi:hypothetical protein